MALGFPKRCRERVLGKIFKYLVGNWHNYMLVFLLCFYSMVVRSALGSGPSSLVAHHEGKGMDYGNRSTRHNARARHHGRHGDHGHAKRPHHKAYGGSIKPHNRTHARLIRDMIDTHGGPENITHEEKDLANMAAHGNQDALGKLYDEGSITPGLTGPAGPVLEDIVPDMGVPGEPMVPVDGMSPPDYSNPNGTYVSNGVATGRTNAEQAEIDGLGQNEGVIDDGVPETAYDSLVSMGHSGPVAKGVADEIRDANAKKKMRIKKAEEMSQPWVNPGYVPQTELAKVMNAKDVVSGADRDMFVKKVFKEYAGQGMPVERAEFEAGQAGLLIDKYNENLALGLSPEVAYAKAMSLVDLGYQHAARTAAIAGGGHIAARGAADRMAIEEAHAHEIAHAPSALRAGLLRRKEEAVNSMTLDRGHELSNDLTRVHIAEPVHRALKKLDQAAALKDSASMEGMSNPVVQERILTDVAASSAEDFAKAHENLENAKMHLKPHGRKTNALNLLSKVNTEKAIEHVNTKNEKMQQEAAKAQKEMNENNAVRTAEEQLARAAEHKIIANAGKDAFAKVLERTGDVAQAEEARAGAERHAAIALNNERESRKEEVMSMLGPMGMNDSVKDAVEHMATAHAGLNVVGSNLDDLNRKYEEEVAHQSNIEALLRETATSNLDVKEVIPPTTSRIGIVGGHMKLPLKGFSNEEAKTEEEAIVQSRQKNRRNQVRNKVIGTSVESGLNVIETENGYTHVSEAAKALKINKGRVFYPENAKGLMEKQKLDTSLLEHRFNTGERPGLEKGVGYYEADASGFTLPLPSPLDPVPSSVMTNGEKSLNIGHASEVEINDGELVQTPWNEFVKDVRPTINGGQVNEGEVAAVSEMKSRVESEKKMRNLEGISTEVYTNPDGSKFVEVSPPYGVSEIMTMDQAVESLNNVGSTSVGAVSEEARREVPDVPLDMAISSSVKGTEEGFVSSVLSSIRKTGSGGGLTKRNAFNGRIDGEKAAIVDEYNRELINEHMSSSRTVEAHVRNSIVSKAEKYARNLGISTQSFLSMVSQLSDSTLKEMMSYNQAPPSARKDITGTQFYNQIASILPDNKINVTSITEMIFNNISTVTHQPNTVGGEVLEQMIVPNLKTVEQVETKRTPQGTTQVSVSVPNNPDQTQVLGEVKFKGNPAVTPARGPRPTPGRPTPAPVGPPVPSSEKNPMRPGAAVPPTRPSRPRAGPGQPDHTMRGFSRSFPGAGQGAPAPSGVGFAGSVAR